MKRDMAPRGVNIEVGGVVVGMLQLLGSDVQSGALCFLLSSNEEIPGLTYICEGVFDEVDRLLDEQGGSGYILIGRRCIGKNPALDTALGKIDFMNQLARHMANKVGAQQSKKEG